MKSNELPEGESFVVALEGTSWVYKTKRGATNKMKKLRAEGKEPTLSTYCRTLLEERT